MKKVLVVDDSPTMRRMIISSLRTFPDVHFEQAESGLDAIEKLTLFNFELVILDLNMPDIHGMEVLKFIRNHVSYDGIPVVILTTKGDENTKNEAIAAGASRFITKPFLPADFAERINELINVKEV